MDILLDQTVNHDLNLDSLPIEIYHFYLFKYFHIDELFRFRSISKRFNLIVKSYKIVELIFKSHIYYDTKDNWFSTVTSSKIKNVLNTSALNLLKNPTSNILSLKYLRISHFSPFSLNHLKKFTKLQILELNRIKIDRDYHLRFPELKALSINVYFDGRNLGNLELDTPLLNSLCLDSIRYEPALMNVVKFKNYHSIKYLKYIWLDESLLIFKNLECLEFLIDEYAPEQLNVDFLKFNNLKKLRFNYDTSYLDVDNSYNSLKNLFKFNNNLEIYLDGVKIQSSNKICEHKATGNQLIFQINNYDDLENDLNFVSCINYDLLVNLLPKEQPSDLLKKYNNINTIKINAQIKDENRLINFIRECPNLYELIIERSSLSQQFYDQLPAISFLFELLVYEYDVNLNFGFLMNMDYLVGFKINQELCLDSLNLNDLKYLRWFKFSIDNCLGFKLCFMINKKNKDKFLINVDDIIYKKSSVAYIIKHKNCNLGLPEQECSLNDVILWCSYLKKLNSFKNNILDNV